LKHAFFSFLEKGGRKITKECRNATKTYLYKVGDLEGHMKSNQRVSGYFQLKNELKAGKMRNIYIFTGSEDFLMDEITAAISITKLGDAYPVNLNRVKGCDFPLGQVLDMAETVSLFGEARLVVVYDAPYFAKGHKEDESYQRLLELNSKKNEPSCIIFYAAEFNRSTKACKELAASGTIYHFDALKPSMINNWLSEKLNAHGKTANSDVLSLLVQRVGRDLRRLASELDKLVTYMGEQRQLDEQSVLIATARSLQGDIFALTDAVINGRAARSLALLRDLLGAGEPPLRILAMLVRQFRMLGESVELLQGGCALDELAARLGVYPFVAEKLASQAVRTNDEVLSRAVDLMLQTDLDIKRGRIDQSLALEALVVALGQKTA
jgi:DNA polymerase III subunit delta